MNEEDLFAAYRNTDEEPDRMGVHSEPGSSKCIVESCPTMIGDWTGRVLCRFHERKLREAKQ
jgi:hypothetical protein